MGPNYKNIKIVSNQTQAFATTDDCQVFVISGPVTSTIEPPVDVAVFALTERKQSAPKSDYIPFRHAPNRAQRRAMKRGK